MCAPLAVDLVGLGLSAPGLPDWQTALPVLRGEVAYVPTPMAKPGLKHLPARDRRRYTFAIALAVTTAMKAVRLDGGEQIPAVFACSGGDTDVINRLCSALMLPGCPVSPQQFVNSVHNAPAGYWSIAERNSAPTTSLSAYDASFAAGLLEAAVQIRAGRRQVLLIAYDVPAPMPIWPFRPLSAPFAVAMLLTAPGLEGRPLAGLDLGLTRNAKASPLEGSAPGGGLEKLRLGNPAARALPLLQAIARARPGDLVLPYLAPQNLGVGVSPCS
jgi:hypothetical protein